MLVWWIFWGALAMLIYTYVGFPMLLVLRGLLCPRPVQHGDTTPTVSFVIAAYNEASVMVEKLDNILALNYPRAQIEIIVASDGSDDGTDDLVAAYGDIHLLTLPRQGKNATLNEAVAVARGDILVFSDADSMLTPDALTHLVAPFSDPTVGGVAGNFHYTAQQAEGSGERAYWRFDRLLKTLQHRSGSITSATGQLYAIRKNLFAPIPLDVTDDFYISAQVHAAHQRLVFAPQARAYSAVAATAEEEFRRKVRVMAGGLRSVWAMRGLLNPVRYGFYALQLLTHKVLRRGMMVPLALMAASAMTLMEEGWIYPFTLYSLIGILGLGALGLMLRHSSLGQSKLFSLPLFFILVNAAFVVAVSHLIRGKRSDLWTSQRTTPYATSTARTGSRSRSA
ncbi:glycosyltransferase family 2 protein [Candidatus Entotheonella palauensis]|uniref:glycosyltransferase family 2 protein n=1 Tax=Candidatus Entotheonella palauensis TaxID=93172 RepID=UPI000B7EE8B1|nr:glycosyltransferase family 2 protein [Candidatus Entotheonella palauensis]